MKIIHAMSSSLKSPKNIVIFSKSLTTGLLFMFIFFISNTQSASALAFCITNDPPTCGITAKITPSAYSIPSGSTLGLTYEAWSIFENGNMFEGFYDWVEESVTGSVSHVPGPWGGTIGHKTQSGTVGPFNHNVTISLWADDQQGDTGYDSIVVTVVSAPPTVNINFSFLDQVKEFFMTMIAAGEKTNTLAVVDTMSTESK